MAQEIWRAIEGAVQLHPGLVFLFGFLVPIAWAYWRFALAPYRKGRRDALLSPWRGAQPVVPGVLERYPAWEWAGESRLTPFGRWLFAELERQHLSLADLARRTGREVGALLPALYSRPHSPTDPATIRDLAAALGAAEPVIERLLRAELVAGPTGSGRMEKGSRR